MPNPKLTIEQVAYAFEQRSLSVSYEWIAQDLGVSYTTLRRYMRNAERYGFAYWIN